MSGAAAPARLTTLDRLTLAYLLAPTLALGLSFRDGPIPGWPWLALAHVLIAACVLLAPRARTAGPTGRFLGDLYPLLLVVALYGEIGVFTLHRGVVHDAAIQSLEHTVFGGQPSVTWIRAMPSVPLSWALHLSYLAYYGILAAAPLGLWVTGRREAARAAILAIMVTFYLHYTVFLFYPVAGPRYFFPLADNAATAVWPARFTQTLLNGADSWGAAFPSSHVAAALVATGMAWRGWPLLGWILAPVTLGLALGVVYGQFHYAVDALAGIVVGAAALFVIGRKAQREAGGRERDPPLPAPLR